MTDNQQPPRNPWDPPQQDAHEASQPYSNQYGAPADSAQPADAHQYEGTHDSFQSADSNQHDAPATPFGSAGESEAPSYGSSSNNFSDPYSHPTNDKAEAGAGSSAHAAPAFAPAGQNGSANSFGTTPGMGAGAGHAQGGQIPAGEPAPGTDLGNDLSKSFSWTFSAFGKNLKALLVPGLVWGLISLIFLVVAIVGYSGIMIATSNGREPTALAMTMMIAGYVLMILPYLAWHSGMAKAAGMIARGEKPTIGQAMFGGRQLALFIVVGIITAIGTILCVIPGIIAGFALTYAVYAAEVDDLGVGEAISASVDLFKKKLALTIIFALLVSVIYSLGGAVALVGMLVAVPVGALFMTAGYMRGTGRVPSEAAAQ